MSIYSGRVRAVLIATLATALVPAGFLMLQEDAAGLWLFFLIGSLLFVGLPALLGILAVMIPMEALARRWSRYAVFPAVVVANLLLTWAAVALIVSPQAAWRASETLGNTLLFAMFAAALWLCIDRIFKKAENNG